MVRHAIESRTSLFTLITWFSKLQYIEAISKKNNFITCNLHNFKNRKLSKLLFKLPEVKYWRWHIDGQVIFFVVLKNI